MKLSSRNQSYLLIAIVIVATILRFNHINQSAVDFNGAVIDQSYNFQLINPAAAGGNWLGIVNYQVPLQKQ